MSWVFLTDLFAYKLKKPVRYPFLDFSTIALRRHFCAEEVRLNRRLAPDVYLGILPISVRPDGELSLGGDGSVIDWLVQMRRLAAEQTLEFRLAAHSVRESDISRLVERLAAFYREAIREPIGPAGWRARVTQAIETNRTELSRAASGLFAEASAPVADDLLRFVSINGPLLDARVLEGRIVEGHGDLRPEHVYLGTDPVVTDCLEFNRELRVVDPADELAYLAIECTHAGAPEIEGWLFHAYGALSGDRPPAQLIGFYKAARALLRTRLAIAHLDEAEPRDSEKWRRRAADYLSIARASLRGSA